MKAMVISLLAGFVVLSALLAQHKSATNDSMDDEARIFMNMFEAGLKNFYVGMGEEYWRFYTRGDSGKTQIYEKVQSEILSDEKTFDRLQEWRGKIKDPLLARRVDLLYRTFAQARVTAQEKIYTLQNSLQDILINFRSTFQGEEVTQNRLTNILRYEEDRDLRKAAWLAKNQVGKEMTPGLTNLIRLRNEEARKLGYRSFYSMSLELADIDEASLFQTLDELDRLSLEPYRKWQSRIKREIKAETLEPWDVRYDYDRFQEELKAYLSKDDILPRLKRTFRGIGLDVEKMPIEIDDEERPGKSQHAYSFPINVPTDVRILANVDDGMASYRTMFHEMGHAVYSASVRQPSYLLQDDASACFTEGVGQFFPMLLRDEKWLTGVGGVPVKMAREYRKKTIRDAPHSIRFYLTIINFEQQAYENPNQDLTRLWWSMTEKYLDLPQHPEIDSWAGIIHFTSHPAYYQNYLLADIIAAQLMHHLVARQGTVLNNPATGEFLRTDIFAKGASVPWEQLLEEITGERLNVSYYVEYKLGAKARKERRGASLASGGK